MLTSDYNQQIGSRGAGADFEYEGGAAGSKTATDLAWAVVLSADVEVLVHRIRQELTSRFSVTVKDSPQGSTWDVV